MSAVKDDLQAKCESLGIYKSKKVASKAAEYFRLLDMKTHGAGGSVNLLARPMICIELACRTLKRNYPKDKLVAMSGASSKEFNQACVAAQSLLNIRFTASLAELCSYFSMSSYEKEIEALLERYKIAFVASLPELQRSRANFNNSSFACVMLFIKAKYHKVYVDKTKLIEASDTTPREFEAVLSSALDLLDLHHLFGEPGTTSSAQATGYKKYKGSASQLARSLAGKEDEDAATPQVAGNEQSSEHKTDQDDVEPEYSGTLPKRISRHAGAKRKSPSVDDTEGDEDAHIAALLQSSSRQYVDQRVSVEELYKTLKDLESDSDGKPAKKQRTLTSFFQKSK